MSLFEISRKRREELLALRSKLRKTDHNQNEPEDDEDESANGISGSSDQENVKRRPKFRSYQPTSNTLKEQMMSAAEPSDIGGSVNGQVANRHLRSLDSIEVADLAPKKPDWDLKRAIEGKLKKLERRTEKAIGEIVRERLQKEAEAEAGGKVDEENGSMEQDS